MAREDYTHRMVVGADGVSRRVDLTSDEIDECVAREMAWRNGDAVKSWAVLRDERNKKLTACDWTTLSDSALTDDKKAEWVAYRKELRDLPASYNDNSVKGTITWPSEPS